jgi:lipopolysaccharide export system permease protein
LTRIDRYILAQLIAAVGFFLLVFTGVVWLTQAVRLIDTVVNSDQGARVFLEFAVLVLPQVLVIVLPLAGIGATLYAVNRLYVESELVVMLATGVSPLALLRPVALFGLLMAGAMAVTTLALVPVGGRLLAERTQEIRADLANALIREGQFLHPTPGLTLFIEDTSQAGEMSGIFLHDQRDPARPVTYSADRALFLREGMEARLVMQDGVALSLGAGGETLNSVQFDQFVYDLSDLLEPADQRTPRPQEYGLGALLRPTPGMLADDRYGPGEYVAEGHYKLALPLMALLYPMLALVTFLAGGFRRVGFGRRVVVAVAVAVLLHTGLILAKARAEEDAALWPVLYLPFVLGLGYVAVLLRALARPRRPARGEAPA